MKRLFGLNPLLPLEYWVVLFSLMSDEDLPKQAISSFLEKLYSILEEESPNIISWNATGDSFIIYSPQLFSQQVMKKYFKSTKFNSFVRQLNFYGFRKIGRESNSDDGQGNTKCWEFKHPQFIRGRKDLLSRIRRKQIGDCDAETETRLQALENQVSYLTQYVTELLIWKVLLLLYVSCSVLPANGIHRWLSTQQLMPLMAWR